MNIDPAAMRIAVIGSFGRHYDAVERAMAVFAQAGMAIASPRAGALLADSEDVRFTDDDPGLGEAELQVFTLERIMAADVVYVVAPDHYVGRATSYEIGRLVQAAVPMYFSASVSDPPIAVPATLIKTPDEVVAGLRRGDLPAPLHSAIDDLAIRSIETRLVSRVPR